MTILGTPLVYCAFVISVTQIIQQYANDRASWIILYHYACTTHNMYAPSHRHTKDAAIWSLLTDDLIKGSVTSNRNCCTIKHVSIELTVDLNLHSRAPEHVVEFFFFFCVVVDIEEI